MFIARKVVPYDAPALELLKNTDVYKLREKINLGGKLTRKEKECLTSYTYLSGDCVLLAGYSFNFSDILKTFVVKQYGNWQEYKATDKTALRKNLPERVGKIVEV